MKSINNNPSSPIDKTAIQLLQFLSILSKTRIHSHHLTIIPKNATNNLITSQLHEKEPNLRPLKFYFIPVLNAPPSIPPHSRSCIGGANLPSRSPSKTTAARKGGVTSRSLPPNTSCARRSARGLVPSFHYLFQRAHRRNARVATFGAPSRPMTWLMGKERGCIFGSSFALSSPRHMAKPRGG